MLGPGGRRTVFALEDVASVSLQPQTGAASVPVTFTPADLRSVPGAVGQIAFGRFLAPDYRLQPDGFIPVVGTRTGTPRAFGRNHIYFNLVLPAGSPPPNGWPVAIFGVVGGSNKEAATVGVASPFAVALARRGIALISVNRVGQTLRVTPAMEAGVAHHVWSVEEIVGLVG